MLREAATLARQDLAGLRPEERVEMLDQQLSGAPQLSAARYCIVSCASDSSAAE